MDFSTHVRDCILTQIRNDAFLQPDSMALDWMMEETDRQTRVRRGVFLSHIVPPLLVIAWLTGDDCFDQAAYESLVINNLDIFTIPDFVALDILTPLASKLHPLQVRLAKSLETAWVHSDVHFADYHSVVCTYNKISKYSRAMSPEAGTVIVNHAPAYDTLPNSKSLGTYSVTFEAIKHTHFIYVLGPASTNFATSSLIAKPKSEFITVEANNDARTSRGKADRVFVMLVRKEIIPKKV